MYTNYFKGTKPLIRFLFRQKRVFILIWLVSLIVITVSVAFAYPSIYQDEEARFAASLTMDNLAMVAMLGPGYESEDYVQSIGAMFANEMLLFSAIAIAIMNIILVAQGTRGDEEDGRLEMIRSLSAGRLAYLSAHTIIVVITNLLLGLLIGLGLTSLGIEGMEAEGSLLYGLILCGTGLLFGAITAIFGQLAETSRETMVYSFTILIVGYLLRAVGDVSSDILSWISPLGWTVRTGVFVDNEWLPVVIAFIVTIALGIIAFYLYSIRDLGAGFVAARKGKTRASRFLQTTFGFTIRLQRTNIIAWFIGLFVLSSAFGAILGDLETYFAENEILQAFLSDGDSLIEQFLILLMAIMALVSVIPVVMTVLRIWGEEKKNYTENIYSRAISRFHLFGTYSLLAIIVSVLLQTAVAFGLWITSFAVLEDPLSASTIFASAYSYLPAIWVVLGIAILLIGFIPKLSSLVWLYVTYCFIVIYLGGLLDFPNWMLNLSVFVHIPRIPVDEMEFGAMIIVTLLAAFFTAIGFFGYRKRDIIG